VRHRENRMSDCDAVIAGMVYGAGGGFSCVVTAWLTGNLGLSLIAGVVGGAVALLLRMASLDRGKPERKETNK
jgi:hypothetical protein